MRVFQNCKTLCFFVCETMHAPLKCSEMLPLEIWNGIISTLWCNGHSRSTMWSQALDAGQHAAGPASSRTWFFRSNRGHGRPPLKAFSLSHLDRVFRPLPHEALQVDQGDQSLSLQSSGHGMWQTSSVYPGKEHRRNLTQISEADNHSNDVGEAQRATAPADLDWFLLKHHEVISRPVAAFLQRSAKHENVYLFIFLLMLSPDDIIRILLALIYNFKHY